ncbi:MAG TPA: efflux RND transporter periplasmic adaptor subunit [Gemmatimonadales bacterium]|nr:efflux RND transporter periplasmic adaptor subunit [Gemmatimonadales bacterium]
MPSRSLQMVSVLWITGSLLGCAEKPAPPPPPPAVTVAPVLQRDVSEWDEFSGRLEAVDQVEIRPRVSGYIKRVTFTEGREVRKGEVLFEIDPREYRADLERAQAQLEQARTAAELAQREVDRAAKLVQVQAISREEFDSRTSAQANGVAAVRAAEAAVETAQLNLGWTVVRSPIAGRVSRAEVTEGNLVQSGPPDATLLTTVVSLDSMYLYFDSDEQTYLRYSGRASAAGNRGWRDARFPVYLGLANETGFPHEGRLDFVDNRIDPASGTIRTRAIFSNRDRRFTPGLFARVKLVGNERAPALLVRDAAIGTDQDHKFVLVVGKADSLEYRSVELGRLSDDGLRIVRKGVQAGEKVVVNGLMRVRPGMKVTPTVVAMVPDSSAATGLVRDSSAATVAER